MSASSLIKQNGVYIKKSSDQIIKFRSDVFQMTINSLRRKVLSYNKQVNVFNECLPEKLKEELKKHGVKDIHFMRASNIYTMYLSYRMSNHKIAKGGSKYVNKNLYFQLNLPPMAVLQSLLVDDEIESKSVQKYTKADIKRVKRHYQRLEESGIIKIERNEDNYLSIFLNSDVFPDYLKNR